MYTAHELGYATNYLIVVELRSDTDQLLAADHFQDTISDNRVNQWHQVGVALFST